MMFLAIDTIGLEPWEREIAEFREKILEVEKELNKHYSRIEASRLLGTWLWIKVQGKELVKKRMNESTYYRHLRQIKNAGIKIENNDMEDFKNGNYEVYRVE
jgi:hypothetical protein